MDNCKFCRKEIVIGAIKCTHCNSFQNWKHYIHFSEPILALLIALTSVIAISIPIFRDAFVPSKAKLELIPLFNQVDTEYDKTMQHLYKPLDYHINIVVVNSGTRPAFINSAKLLSQNQKTPYDLIIENNEKRVIKPGSYEQLRISADHRGYMPYGYMDGGMRKVLQNDSVLLVEVRQVDGTLDILKKPLGKIWDGKE